jgi:hypothetical protein
MQEETCPRNVLEPEEGQSRVFSAQLAGLEQTGMKSPPSLSGRKAGSMGTAVSLQMPQRVSTDVLH